MRSKATTSPSALRIAVARRAAQEFSKTISRAGGVRVELLRRVHDVLFAEELADVALDVVERRRVVDQIGELGAR